MEGTAEPNQKSDGILSDPEAIQAARESATAVAALMRLPFRDRVWKGASGEFQGGGVGSSIDFQDHRAYIPGDDPRHINWQAYARTGNYTMKLYREEVRPQVDVLLDISRSMFVGKLRAMRTLELFLFCLNAAVQTGASVKAWLVSANRHRFISDVAVNTNAWAQTAIELQEETVQSPDPPAIHTIPLRQNAMRVFVSDLLFPESPERIASALSARSGRGVLFAPFSHEEAEPEWQGNYEFIEAEDRERHLRRVEPALVKRYRQAYKNHFSLWKNTTAKHGIAFARVPAESPLQQALHQEGLLQRAIEMA
jgi:uncharacterized protein (DUF58 family)